MSIIVLTVGFCVMLLYPFINTKAQMMSYVMTLCLTACIFYMQYVLYQDMIIALYSLSMGLYIAYIVIQSQVLLICNIFSLSLLYILMGVSHGHREFLLILIVLDCYIVLRDLYKLK